MGNPPRRQVTPATVPPGKREWREQRPPPRRSLGQKPRPPPADDQTRQKRGEKSEGRRLGHHADRLLHHHNTGIVGRQHPVDAVPRHPRGSVRRRRPSHDQRPAIHRANPRPAGLTGPNHGKRSRRRYGPARRPQDVRRRRPRPRCARLQQYPVHQPPVSESGYGEGRPLALDTGNPPDRGGRRRIAARRENVAQPPPAVLSARPRRPVPAIRSGRRPRAGRVAGGVAAMQGTAPRSVVAAGAGAARQEKPK